MRRERQSQRDVMFIGRRRAKTPAPAGRNGRCTLPLSRSHEHSRNISPRWGWSLWGADTIDITSLGLSANTAGPMCLKADLRTVGESENSTVALEHFGEHNIEVQFWM